MQGIVACLASVGVRASGGRRRRRDDGVGVIAVGGSGHVKPRLINPVRRRCRSNESVPNEVERAIGDCLDESSGAAAEHVVAIDIHSIGAVEDVGLTKEVESVAEAAGGGACRCAAGAEGVGAEDQRCHELAHEGIRGGLVLAAEADATHSIGIDVGEAGEVDAVGKGGDGCGWWCTVCGCVVSC